LCYSFNQMRKYKNSGSVLFLFTAVSVAVLSVILTFLPTPKAMAASSEATAWCKTAKVAELSKCENAYDDGKAGKKIDDVCPPISRLGRNPSCQAGFDEGAKHKPPAPSSTVTSATQAAKDACKDYGPSGTKPNHSQALFEDCLAGYAGGADGKDLDDACKKSDYTIPSDSYNACKGGYSAGKASTGDDTSDCVVEGSTTFEWILCPITTALGKSAEAMNGFVENQLNFSSKDFLPESGSNDGVYKAWSIVKNLVTSVLIILLLVMVISQAVGTGVFEAYTIKKVLPRLLIAVVAMQISWELCKFAVDIANDLGNGVANLITAPFGGADNMDLSSLLGRLSGALALGANVGLAAALTVSAVLAISNPAGAALIAFSVIMAVLVALATILFRNVIIIACVMLSPLAILLWVLPMKGLQSYWNLWRDNFTKALLLFPLMAAVIYTGRVFAWIVSGLQGPGFIDLIMVLVGFFGPYFLLPSMFKRGGSLLSSGYDAINKGSTTLGKKPKEYLGARKEEYGKLRKQQSQRRVSEGNPTWWRGDKFRSGQWDPAYKLGSSGRLLGEAHMAHYEAAGASAIEEENKQFESSIEAREKGLNERAGREYWFKKQGGGETREEGEAELDRNNNPIRARLRLSGDKDDLVQAIAKGDNSVKFKMVDGRELTIEEMFPHVGAEHQEAALGRMAALGGNPNLTALNDEVMDMMDKPNDPEVQRRLNRFLGRTAGSMFAKMPHWYKGVNGAANGLSPEALSAVSGASMNEMLSSLESKARAGDKESSKDLSTLLRTWGEAVKNPNIAGRIDKSSVQRLSEFLNPSRLNANLESKLVVNAGDAAIQQDTHNVIATLRGRVTPTGDIRAASTQQEQQGQAGAGGNEQEGSPANGGGVGARSSAPGTHPQNQGGAAQGGGGAPGAGGGTYTGPREGAGEAASGLGKSQVREAFIEAIEQTGLGQQHSTPGEINIPHGPGQVISPTINVQGPNIPTQGTTESGLHIPQERRTRPQEPPENPQE
jgi:hypothetical protein